MSLFAMRPTFESRHAFPKDEFVRRVSAELRKPAWSATSLVFDEYAELHVPQTEVRYWSPHLSLSFDGDQDHTRVLGRFAPRQEVWTLIWIIYLALAFTGFFALIYTYAHWILGQSTWIGIIPPLTVAGIGSLYLASHIGQQLSSDQMLALRSDWAKLIEQVLPADNRLPDKPSAAT